MPFPRMNPLFGAALFLLYASAGFAQGSTIQFGGTIQTVGTEAELRAMKPIAYTAEWKTIHVQRESSGLLLTSFGGANAAHDSAGRTFSEIQLPTPKDNPRYFSANVYDPVRKITIMWYSNSDQATITHFPVHLETQHHDPRPIAPRPAPAAEPGQSPPVTQSEATSDPLPRPEPTVEELGPEIINGFEATGTRQTTVTPPAHKGDKPTVVIEEWWYHTIDPGLAVEVLHTQNFIGTLMIRQELVSFERGEPDPALFEPPPDYEVRDVYPEEQPPRRQDPASADESEK